MRNEKKKTKHEDMGRTWKSGKSLLKSDVPTDELKRSKNCPSAPTPTLRFVLAFTHGCGLAVEPVVTTKSAWASRFRNKFTDAAPPSADSPMSTSGTRCPDALNVALTSGLVEIVTSVVGIQVALIWVGRSAAAMRSSR